MFEQWSQDPQSVHPSWRTFFELENKGFGKGLSYTPPPGMNKATPLPQVASSMSLDDIQAHVKVIGFLLDATLPIYHLLSIMA